MSATMAIQPFLEADHTYLSPQRIASRLNLPLEELAGSARVHRNSLRVRPGGPKIQAFLRQVVRVLAAAEEAFGDQNTAVAWLMNEPLAAFEHRTAFELVHRGRGDDVVAYLASIRSGFVG